MHKLRKDDVVYRLGVPPEEGRYPGFGYTVRREHGLIVERDVGVRMRDGVMLYVDVIRPDTPEPVPVILTYSPYGKHALKGAHMLKPAPGKGDADVVQSGLDDVQWSHYTAWEGPDPLWWCERGYAVINADARGSWGSEGTLTFHSTNEAEDGYDLVEWAARQIWCTGRVGMSGVSYLAWSQWNVAALRPPHLCAINPWEGYSDPYRDISMQGGIRETRFRENWIETTAFSRTRVEDVVEMTKLHPLIDEYWESRIPSLEDIVTPLYAVVDWGDHGVHTRGTIEGFKRVSSQEKWLEVHGRLKWPYYYRPESLRRLLAFFDRFLKGDASAMADRPRVEIEVRERAFVGEVRSETEWPLAATTPKTLHLDAAHGTLRTDGVSGSSEARYDSASEDDCAEFRHVFSEDTELTGNIALQVWMSASIHDDMDIFVALNKLDVNGERVGFVFGSMLRDGPVALGWLRASHRELDVEKSTPLQPWHPHKREIPVTPGEVIRLDVEILPTSTLFRKGETLVLTVAGHNLYGHDVPFVIQHEDTRNAGEHVIYCSQEFPSHLLIPLIPARGRA